LPYYLEQDLHQVFDALSAAGFGLGEAIKQVLRTDRFRLMARVQLPGYVLELRRAMEFWPLLGDVTSEEQGGSSRLIDSSTTRIELRLRPAPIQATQDMATAGAWPEIAIAGSNLVLPLRPESDHLGELKVRPSLPALSTNAGLASHAGGASAGCISSQLSRSVGRCGHNAP
jgi:hypothetical protein